MQEEWPAKRLSLGILELHPAGNSSPERRGPPRTEQVSFWKQVAAVCTKRRRTWRACPYQICS
jgi:hypothetical protein